MIPKIIHYCWFGGNELPKSAVKCVNSWKKFCPDYKIIEWNEQNFDISSAPLYVRQAYENKKFAFVADYVRLYALYNHGGIYMDTDVEVVNSLGFLSGNNLTLGFEEGNYIATSFMAADVNNDFIKKFLDTYNNEAFLKEDGSLNTETNVYKLTKMLEQIGLERNNLYQELQNSIVIYPREYFAPYNNSTGVLNKTKNTIAIHWYDKTWIPFHKKIRSKITRPFHRLFGVDCFEFLKR